MTDRHKFFIVVALPVLAIAAAIVVGGRWYIEDVAEDAAEDAARAAGAVVEERLSAESERLARVAYRNSIEACRRGNPLRRVVFANTRNAIAENADNPQIARVFEENLAFLLTVDNVDPKSGAVACIEAVRRPPDLNRADEARVEGPITEGVVPDTPSTAPELAPGDPDGSPAPDEPSGAGSGDSEPNDPEPPPSEPSEPEAPLDPVCDLSAELGVELC